MAKGLTTLHVKVTGAKPQEVKVMFFDLDRDSLFIGGERVKEYVRVIAQIRQGRTEAQKLELLEGMNRIMRAAVSKGEIQVQILEIDDTKTVMTNGVMNT